MTEEVQAGTRCCVGDAIVLIVHVRCRLQRPIRHPDVQRAGATAVEVPSRSLFVR
jgi:hypothetical protein